MEPYTKIEDIAGIIARKETRDRIETIRSADILVGIPSYNNAGTIGHVVLAVQAGLAKYFPERKAVIVNSDGGSTDGTVEIVKNTMIDDFQSVLLRHRGEPALRMSIPYHGIPGKGSAFRAIFEMAAALNVEACAVLDADLRSITPEWLELLLKPVLEEGFDYVAPLYRRHKFDGTITNSIIYPLTRAVYGKRVRQPIGGDFGFSGRLAQFYLMKDVWETDVARYGIDIWMTTQAIANEFKIAQAFLGAKIHDAKDPGADLSDMLFQVVGSAFSLMKTYHNRWKNIQGSTPVRTFGFQYEVGLEQVKVDVAGMLLVFREGVRNLKDIWESVIGSGDFEELRKIAGSSDEKVRISDQLWARVVYDYALAYHKRKVSAEHLLKSLTPLYLAKTASFILEVRDMDQNETETKIEKLCMEFEENKEYLVSNWK